MRARTLFLVALVLAMPLDGQAGIVVEGDQAFKDAVADALTMIRVADPALAAKLDNLEMSSNTHLIKEARGSRTKSSNSTTDGRSATNGTGTGSTTRWNRSNTRAYPNDVARDPVAVLAHELGHACEVDSGTIPTGADINGIDPEEVDAVIIENLYRTSPFVGLPLRRKYGGNPMPDTPQLCETCTNPPNCDGACPPVQACIPGGDGCLCLQFTPSTPPCGALEGPPTCTGACPEEFPICKSIGEGEAATCMCAGF